MKSGIFICSAPAVTAERFLVKMLRVADMQRVDMGIAMCHFELAAGQFGLAGKWEINDPGLPLPDESSDYVVSWIA